MTGLPGSFEIAAGSLLTYLIHSSILMGGAWILTRSVVRSAAWRETLWRTALLGSLLTTAIASSVRGPAPFQLSLPGVAAGVVEERPGGGDPAARTGERPAPAGGEPVSGEATRPGDAGAATASRASGSPAASAVAAVWPRFVVLGWSLIAAALLLRLGLRHARLRWRLRDRRPPGDERGTAVLAELRRSAGLRRRVRLTATPAVATPLVLGSSEICVPERFEQLRPEEQRAALAHELGHLARRDPWWQLAANVLESVFFFQPLHRVVRAGVREAAEYRADAWAVRHASRLGLARCLAEVAEWAGPRSGRASSGALAMAEEGSPLLSRARRLLEDEPERTPAASARYGAVAVVVLLTAGFAPAVVPGPAGEPAAVEREQEGPGPATDTTRAVRGVLGRYLVDAAERGDHGTALRLIEAGADVDRRVSGDGTPLIVAARAGRLRMVELLLEHGADVDRPSPGDGNPLIMASAYGHGPIVTLLVQHGADVDAVVEGDETPLINAAGSGHLEVVRHLVEHGADVNLHVLANPETRPERRSPLGAAIRAGHDEIAEFLRARGATLPRQD